jgi:cob(I)alamin adenosyltransferase
VVALSLEEQVEAIIVKYLNRLSDFLFVLSRHITRLQAGDDVLWIPR